MVSKYIIRNGYKMDYKAESRLQPVIFQIRRMNPYIYNPHLYMLVSNMSESTEFVDHKRETKLYFHFRLTTQNVCPDNQESI